MSTLKFYPFQSAVDPGFWHTLGKKKLDEFKLNEESRKIRGTMSITHPPQAVPGPRINITYNAFTLDTDDTEASWNQAQVEGEMLLLNTIESFKQMDKAKWIKTQGEKVWNCIQSGDFWENPSSLCTFSAIIYADLKKFQFYYWFNFPSFNITDDVKVFSCKKLSNPELSCSNLEMLTEEAVKYRKENQNTIFALVKFEGYNWSFHPFKTIKDIEISQTYSSRCYLCLYAPSGTTDYPSWPLRNLVVALSRTRPATLNVMEVLSLRIGIKDGKYDISESLVISLQCDESLAESSDMPSVVGWEKNEKGQMGPRFVNMRSSMDPVKIAESSVDLNLKLMKWRLVPDINLDAIGTAKFLILGSGTLGCGVARCLLGWGARNITFVDNAKVSYSNPVRQSLFEFKDCLDGGKMKASAAANKLKDIFPGVVSNAHELTIPMPGHPIAAALEAEVKASYDTLKKLIDKADVIFLLMDSRESRWLPTVIAASKPDKILINAALGFDTYLVMRHGIRPPGYESGPVQLDKEILPGKDLGCYYCNDVVAPGDSLSDRTLDMQCTVTRPGVSAIAAALAVELAVSCLQHPEKGGASCLMPSGKTKGTETLEHSDSESVLGLIPHSIRGSVHTYNQYMPATPAFSQCTGCSKSVIEAYAKEGFELVKKVGENSKYLEDLTGLTNLLSDSNIMDGVIDIGDDDEFSISSD